MLGLLRFVGVFNAAIWLGGGVFFTFGIGPGIFSAEMKRIFPGEYTGYIGQLLIERYFTFNLICGIIAFGHFAAEIIYAGKPFRRLTFGLLVGIMAVGLFTAHFLAPRIKQLHFARYRGPVEQRAAATQQLGRIHAVSAVGNLLTLAALVFYTWQVTNPSDPMRFVGSGKFRG